LVDTDPSTTESIHVTLDEVKDAVTVLGKLKQRIRRLSITIGQKIRSHRKSADEPDISPELMTSSISAPIAISQKRPSLPSELLSSSLPSEESIQSGSLRRYSNSPKASPSYLQNQPSTSNLSLTRSASSVSSISIGNNSRAFLKSSISQELLVGTLDDSMEDISRVSSKDFDEKDNNKDGKGKGKDREKDKSKRK